MALFQGVFRSAALNQDTCFNVIIPQDCPKEELRTVYLLHGMHGDHTGWCRKTSIERYAQDRRLAIVMPDGENGFYTDMKYGKKHYTYVSTELGDALVFAVLIIVLLFKPAGLLGKPVNEKV